MARVLVVDDEKSLRISFGDFLRNAGYEVVLAEDAESGLRSLAEADCDVIVTDVVMPRVTGVELLRAVRQVAPHAQVILMTGEPTAETAAQALRAGAYDYLFKPVGKEPLLRAVKGAARLKVVADEKRRLEEENRAYREQLEQLVRERTAALEEALHRLEAAQQQVIQHERLRALGTMASGIAHDFNNCLTPILGFSELLLMDPAGLSDHARVAELLGTIQAAAEDAGVIVNRLRQFYRFREDDEEFLPTELKPLLQQALSLTEPKWKSQAQAKGITIGVRTEFGRPPVVQANEPELREALTNLIFNAVDAMPEGGTLTLRTRAEDGYAVLEVRDTGTGMSEEVRQRCLEPFFTTKGTEGTGLGLAMVYGIVTRHGGTIEITTELGKGTTFSMRLPVEPGAASRTDELEAVRPRLPKLRLLVVEDEARVREVLKCLLALEGHQVETASQGREGLEKFSERPFDAVITDRAMPEMNGDQLASAIKARAPATPVILLSGFGNLMKALGESAEHFDVVVGKPVRIDELRRALAEVVSRATGDTQEQRP